MAKANETTEAATAGPDSSMVAELAKRLDAMQGTLQAIQSAKDAEIMALKAQLGASEAALQHAKREQKTIFEQAKERVDKWEAEERSRLEKVEAELLAGSVQFELSLPSEPRMTRRVGANSGSPAEAIAKYNVYFGRIAGPMPQCVPVSEVSAV